MNICLNCNHSRESHIEYYIPSSPSSSIIVSCIDCENTPLSDELDERYCSKFEEQQAQKDECLLGYDPPCYYCPHPNSYHINHLCKGNIDVVDLNSQELINRGCDCVVFTPIINLPTCQKCSHIETSHTPKTCLDCEYNERNYSVCYKFIPKVSSSFCTCSHELDRHFLHPDYESRCLAIDCKCSEYQRQETLYNDLVWYDKQHGTLYSVPYAAIETEMCYCGHEENKHRLDNSRLFLYQNNACSCNYKSLYPYPLSVINGPCQCSKFTSLSRAIRDVRQARETIKNNIKKSISDHPEQYKEKSLWKKIRSLFRKIFR